MDYPLENLDPERFQQLCQALLAKEYPQLQCFPVAQPDGGRDAVSFFIESSTDKFMVFQVKFVRKPQVDPDPHKWLQAVMEAEAPKVQALIPRGAARYVLITNISGTAHLDHGSIDKLNELLKTRLDIPATCWWRDDVNRRLDNSWDLKWKYPDILSGSDFLRIILESGITEQRERRSVSVRAFLRTQYDLDEEVRFKQVELQNKLLDLFVDVPITLRDPHLTRRVSNSYRAAVHLTRSAMTPDDDEVDLEDALFSDPSQREPSQQAHVGAATLLLNGEMQRRLPHVVVEGAPGQGKSTITQYVCQIHRMRLLQQEAAISLVEDSHLSTAVRLPIRVDLRDFALWLGKKDPFNPNEIDTPPTNWHKSLDAFLAALVSHQSGGTQFTVDDLLAVFKVSAVLIVFDGLDEVADMNRRSEVVEEIVRGVQRLESNAASMQTIVTSRPAAFANSPGMPHEKYPHLQLLSLPRTLIMKYAERWLRARRLDSKQASEFRGVLKEKLDQPHLRDLARNPMQLAILLSLVLTRGSSLPDKRTALYDYYIDLFFSREAEKSTVVRNHRDLLIDIHRHLAWLLQSQAERDNSRPSIPQEQLQRLVSEYLAREGHPSDLAKELFTGMIERVVALVSRVEGTFEFEVQPLQEYFAACHLYYTAPQSSPGREMPGSKPDRFDAIARNFYWFNVTRFYAGCYSKGELPSLVERLQELASSPGYQIISYPRTLSATLLSDWVFTQNPRSVLELVELITEQNSLRYILAPYENRSMHASAQNPLVLPPRCGGSELITRCFQVLGSEPPSDLATQVLSLLRANSESSTDVTDTWFAHTTSVESQDRPLWIHYGVLLGSLSTISLDRVHKILESEATPPRPHIISSLFRARRLDLLHSSEDIFEEVVNLILSGQIVAQPQRRIESPLDAISHALDLGRYSSVFNDRQPVPLARYWEGHHRAAKLSWPSQLTTATESYKSHPLCVELAQVAEQEAQKSLIEWSSEIEPWNNVIETGRRLWGNRWRFTCLANVAAGIRSTTNKCSECSELLNRDQPLAKRVRYARLRSGAHRWWTSQIEAATNSEDLLLVLLVFFSWATPATWLQIGALVDQKLNTLTASLWHRLYQAIKQHKSVHRGLANRVESLDVDEIDIPVGLRLATLLADRLTDSNSEALYNRYVRGTVSDDPIVLELIQRQALDIRNVGKANWKPDLGLIQALYSQDIVREPLQFHRRYVHSLASMDENLAAQILEKPTAFPAFIVSLAEDSYRAKVASRITPVATIAEQEKWF